MQDNVRYARNHDVLLLHKENTIFDFDQGLTYSKKGKNNLKYMYEKKLIYTYMTFNRAVRSNI